MKWIIAVALLVAAALLVWTFIEKSCVTSRVYTIGWENDPPDEFPDSKGQPTGMIVEIVREAAQRSGIQLQWVRHDESSEAALRSGGVDLWSSMTITPERAKILHISAPYLESIQCLLVPRASVFQRQEDLAKGTIGYLGLPITSRQAHALMPDARLITMRSPKDLVQAVCQQRVDAGFIEHETAIVALMSGISCPDQPLRVIHIAADRQLLLGVGSTFKAAAAADRIRVEIGRMAAEGKLAELFVRWGSLSGRNLESVKALVDAQRRARWTMLAAAVFAALFAIAWWQAARAVRQRNRARQAEMALRESEERYRSIIETAQEGIWTLDADGRFTYVNEKLATMLGYGREELLGQPVDAFVDPSLLEASRQNRERRKQGVREHYDFIFRRKDGSVLHAIVAASPVYDGRGNYTGGLGMVADITARKQAEEALRQSEEKYRCFFEEDLAGYFIASPDGKLLECNPAFVRMFGFASHEEALAHTLASLYPNPETEKAFIELVESRGRLQEHECDLRRRDGTPLSVISNVIGSRNDSGELEEIRGYVVDNTERKKAEEQLRLSQKMDAIGRLAGGVAHDFNNLLSVIIGYSSRLLSKLPQSDLTYGEAAEIKSAAERAAALTDQLLAFGRKQVLQPRVLNLSEVISHMIDMLQRLIGEHIDLALVPHPKLDMVKADVAQIEQVIMNLVINSRDAMPNGGQITIETANVFLSEQDVGRPDDVPPGRYVMVAVSDNGCGIDAAIRPRIFEPFFTTKEHGQGIGLGLSTVYGIVNQNGGYISVYSEPGRGARFNIYLPTVPETISTLPKEEPEEELAIGSGTILVAEDDDSIRGLIQSVLTEKGYTVLSARDPREAIRIQQQHSGPIDLLLTDMVMPDMSGRELAECLAPARPQMKVLYVSGYTEDAMVHQGVLAPGTTLLMKPFSPQALLREVHRVLKPAGNAVAILIVEDHPNLRELTRATLEEAGYRILEACDAQQAMEHLAEGNIDLVITDLNLPGQSGRELVKAVKTLYPAVKLIIVSGAFESVQTTLAQQIGINAILPKPVDPETLLETVRGVLA